LGNGERESVLGVVKEGSTNLEAGGEEKEGTTLLDIKERKSWKELPEQRD